MKELSLFMLKNSVASKMKKGFRNSCNGESSTSTVDHLINTTPPPKMTTATTNAPTPMRTLEEMILQLELEEEMARQELMNKKRDGDKVSDILRTRRGRMSCVNNSDIILTSARNAMLNQYPRFSLDGKDAMYRSSFCNFDSESGSGYNTRITRDRVLSCTDNTRSNLDMCLLPQTLAGERVVWCKPGVVAKLMGLEAMPLPVNSRRSKSQDLPFLAKKRQSLRSRAAIREIARKVTSASAVDVTDCVCGGDINRKMPSSSTTCYWRQPGAYRVVKPDAVGAFNHREILRDGEGGGGWPTRRFRF